MIGSASLRRLFNTIASRSAKRFSLQEVDESDLNGAEEVQAIQILAVKVPHFMLKTFDVAITGLRAGMPQIFDGGHPRLVDKSFR